MFCFIIAILRVTGNHLSTGTVEYIYTLERIQKYTGCCANNNYIVALLDGQIAKYMLLSKAFCKCSTLQM